LEVVIVRVSLVENEVLMPVAQHPIDLDEQVVMNGGSCYQTFWQMYVRNLEVEG
jgi:hypothetical protein